MKRRFKNTLAILRYPEFFQASGDDGRKIAVAAIIGGFIGFYVKSPQISPDNAMTLIVMGVTLWLACTMIGVSGTRQLKNKEDT